MIWKEILYVGAGSFLGGALRYAVSLILKCSGGFPWATFSVNMIGCLLIGLLMGLSMRLPNIFQQVLLFLSIGFCGGFTTFSTFSKEGLMMLQSANYLLFAIYVLASILFGLALVAAGYFMVK